MKILLYTVLCVTLLFGCDYSEDYFSGLQSDMVVKFKTPATSEIFADGTTITDFDALIPLNAVDSRSTVEFRLTDGTFVGSEKPQFVAVTAQKKAIENKVATVNIKSPLTPTNESVIRATIAGYEAVHKFKFKNAPPESLKIIPSSLSLKGGLENEIVINVQGIRSIGIPSIGNKISIQVKDAKNNSVGSFRLGTNAETDSSGKCVFTLSVDKTVTGIITVTATLDGTQIFTTKEITIQPL